MNRPLTLEEDFELKFQERLAQKREEVMKPFDSRSLLWLALLPTWNEKLALACDFPTGERSLALFLQQAEEVGLCEQQTMRRRNGRQRQKIHQFWMPKAMRPETLELLSRELSERQIVQEVSKIGHCIASIEDSQVYVAPEISRWAVLAVQSKEGVKEVASWLQQEINELIEAGDSGQALAWVRAATDLAQALRGELEVAIMLSNRRIELAYRKSQDERRLDKFIEREAQIDAFNALLDNKSNKSNQQWALHYLGMGGVGKTMLLRHINTHLAQTHKLVISRVDFDYLTPDYPARRPGQLLLELAGELRLHFSDPQQENRFERFRSQVVYLHEELSDAPPQQPLTNIRHDLFEDVLDSFARMVQLLPAPVLLILDTCEELAKLRPVGNILPSVEATFDILERLHAKVATLRVIFAGRRLLAQAGHGWRVEMHKQYLPSNKPYLRLHLIQGFTEHEADTFLSQFEPEKRPFTSEMKQAILEVSPDMGTPADLVWQDDAASRAEKIRRYNPFNLALYGQWLQEDPHLTVATITSGQTDPYVEARIVQRLKEANIHALLPGVALLRRFNKDILRPLFTGNDDAFDEAYRALSDHEWIDSQRNEQSQTLFLQVQPNLHQRLYQYYLDKQDPSRQLSLKRARQSLAPKLALIVEQTPLNQLSKDHINGALRLLEENIEAATTLWDQISRRIVTEADWSWALNVTDRLLFDEWGAASAANSPLRAAVLATYAATKIQLEAHYDPTQEWNEVAETAKFHPNPAIRQSLTLRALAGQIAVTRVTNQPLSEEQMVALSQAITHFPSQGVLGSTHYQKLIASFLAALEALLDRAELTNETHLIPHPDSLKVWAYTLRRFSPLLEKLPSSLKQSAERLRFNALKAFALMLAGRAMALQDSWDEAHSLLKRAESLTPADEQIQPPLGHDWRAPASIQNRVRLEWLRLQPISASPLSAKLEQQWLIEACESFNHAPEIDSERLISAILQWQLARELIPAETLHTLRKQEQYKVKLQPVCAAHEVTPSLFVSLAQAWLARGDAQQALAILEEREHEATLAGEDKRTVTAAQSNMILVACRMRLKEVTQTLLAQQASALPEEESWPLAVLCGLLEPHDFPRPDQKWPYQRLHAWWRCQYDLKREQIEPTMTLLEDIDLSVEQTKREGHEIQAAHLALDAHELMLVAQKHGLTASPPVISGEYYQIVRLSAGESSQQRAKVEERLRLRLRVFALVDDKNRADLNEWAGTVGLLSAAEMALEEGQLLALRLPEKAAKLLRLAHQWFIQAKEPVGAVRSGILAAITLIRAGSEPAKVQALLPELIKADYDKLVDSQLVDNIPTWSQLLALRDTLSQEKLQQLDHPSWGGWLSRLFRCLVWAVEPDETGEITSQFYKWQGNRYEERLPLELSLGYAADTYNPKRSQNSLPLDPIILLGVSYAAYKLGKYIFGNNNKKLKHNLIISPHSSIIARSTDILPKEAAIEVSIDLSQDPLILRFTTVTSRSEVKAVKRSDQPRWLRAYGEAAEEMRSTLINELTSLWEKQDEPILPVPLYVEQALAWYPWEAMLTLALERSGQWRKRFHFWRVVVSSAIGRNSGWEQGEVHVIASPTWKRLFRYGWRSLTKRINVDQEVWRLRRAKNIKLLHLVGTPIQTSAGLHLQIQDDYYRQLEMSQESTRALGGETLINSKEVPLKQTGVVVIQAPPVEIFFKTKIIRQETDRELAAYLRTFAAELMAAGAQIVLVLPALPPEVAQEVIITLSQSLQGDQIPDQQRLLKAISQVQKTIVSWNDSDMDSKIELALEVCLFARQEKE